MNDYDGSRSNASTHSNSQQSSSADAQQSTEAPSSGGSWRVQLKRSLSGAGYAEAQAALAPSVQRRGGAPAGNEVSIAESAFKGGGGPVPHGDRVGSAIGADLSGVTAYTGPAAKAACDALGAEAFTYGNKMAYRDAAPKADLVAHESKHAVHQGAAPSTKPALSVAGGASASAMEAEADDAAKSL